MKKTILEIYALAVCFVIVVSFAFSLGVGIYDVVKITYPEFTMSNWEYAKFQNNDAYRASNNSIGSNNHKDKQISETEITKKRLEAFSNAITNEKREGAQGLMIALIILLINCLIFIPHWIIARKARV
jgi:hypothetical protein